MHIAGNTGAAEPIAISCEAFAPETDCGTFAFRAKTFCIVPASDAKVAAAGTGPPPRGDAVGSLICDGRHHLIYEVQNTDGPEPQHLRLTDILTRREIEITLLIAEGRCDKEIGRSLGISNYTVREHIRRTCAKLGVSRRAAIASVVVRGLSGNLPPTPKTKSRFLNGANK